jgi:hypothetical protein
MHDVVVDSIGKTAITVGDSKSITVWSLRRPAVPVRTHKPDRHCGALVLVALDRSGMFVATADVHHVYVITVAAWPH